MTDFDPEFDKISDQPVTIGGDKSAAAWHPNSAPEVPYADLRERIANALQDDVYACTRVWEAWQVGTMTADDFTPAWENEDVLDNIIAALGDTVSVAEHERLVDEAEAVLLKDLTEANNDRLRFEDGYHRVLAERDALAHVIERGRALRNEAGQHLSPWAKHALDRLLAEAGSSEALALHDAEIRALALEKEAEAFDSRDEDVAWVHRWLSNRAAATRAEAK
jgi:hypothetical protein